MGLFSTTHHHHTKTVNVPYEKKVTVNEYRAPTDKSVELLNEMQEKAKSNIIETIKVEENHLKAVAICYLDQSVTGRDQIEFWIKFELNGKEYIIKDYIDNYEWGQEISTAYKKRIVGLAHQHIFKFLHKKFAEMISEELMNQSTEFLTKITKGL